MTKQDIFQNTRLFNTGKSVDLIPTTSVENGKKFYDQFTQNEALDKIWLP